MMFGIGVFAGSMISATLVCVTYGICRMVRIEAYKPPITRPRTWKSQPLHCEKI